MSAHGTKRRYWATSSIILLGLVLVSLRYYTVGSSAPAGSGTSRNTEERSARPSGRAWQLSKADPGVLGGQVVSSTQQRIPGARVCAARADRSLLDAPPAVCTETDEEGLFSFARLSDGAYLVSATADGFAMASASSGAPLSLLEGRSARQSVTIVLQAGGVRVSGLVLDALGGPVSQARVQVARFENAVSPTLELESDSEGRFGSSVPGGPVTLRAEADGYAPALVHVMAPTRNVRLVLVPGSTIRGRVVELGTATPVADVSIRAVTGTSAALTRPAISDDDGVFVLTGIEPGNYVFTAEGEHHRGGSSQAVEVGLAESMDDVQIEVAPAASITGRIEIEHTQQPCTRGRVAIGPENPLSVPSKQASPRHAASSVDALIEPDGLVHLHGVLPGSYHVTLQCFDHVFTEGPRVLEVAEQDLSVRWHVAPGIGLLVEVVDDAGHAVPRARLSLQFPPAAGGRAGVMPLSVDANGRATLPRNLLPGSYRIRPDPSYGVDPLEVRLREGSPQERVVVRLPGTGAIEVQVHAGPPEAEPIDGLDVSALVVSESSVAADNPGVRRYGASGLGDGMYRIGPLKPGEYNVEVRDGVNPALAAKGARGASLLLRSGQVLRVDAVLERGAKLTGRVVDELGVPIGSAWLSAQAEDAELSSAMRFALAGVTSRVLTDADGLFEIAGLQTEQHYRVLAEQHHGGAASATHARPGTELVLRLLSPGVLSGTVRDREGRPAHRATVTAHHEATGVIRYTQLRAEGTFRLEGIPAGSIELSVAELGGDFAGRQVEIVAGQELEGLTLTLESSKPLAEPSDSSSPGPLANSAPTAPSVQPRAAPAE
ncbi:MAG: hypothetical protein JWN04_2718 [Myxococcaceae bacterium]|nr:hypothetical protein [Myxococcaceae bacterium]